ncbi:MAG: extracellular solute-binding protein [Clostridia bacterium]
MKKLLILVAVAALVIGVVSIIAGAESSGEIFFLNFKPEIADVYTKIAADYKAETGVAVKVVTAASGTYEQTLMSELAKADAPTIFQVNGPVSLPNYREYTADLTDSSLAKLLSDPSFALKLDGQVLAVPYAVEGYGIIYNAAILKRYFASPNQKTGYAAVEEIKSFAALKAVVEDMTALKDELGIQGVFASTSMAAGNQWRWQTHLLNLPLYYEFKALDDKADTVLTGVNAKTIAFQYNENFRNTFDLYLRNSTTEPGLLSNKTVDDSMAEFALGQCAMVQNGNWGASQILGVEGNTVADADIKFLPIYTGMPGEERQGLCVGTENYLCINRNVSQEKQQASIDFLTWLFSSEKGKAYVKNELGFIVPFTSFGENDKPADPLSVEVMNWMNKEGIVSVPWTLLAFPSENFKNDVGDALLEYVQGSMPWQDVVTVTVDSWAAEK